METNEIEPNASVDAASGEPPTEPSADTETDVDSDGKRVRMRSTIKFPYIDLVAALELATAIRQGYGNVCSADQLAAATGHAGVRTGAFARKIAGAQVFGLVNREGDQVSLSELGKMAVQAETSSKARAMAFLEVDLYKAIYQEFKGGTLPADTGVGNYIKSLGVPEKQVDVARQIFRRSADQAGFFGAGKDRLVAPAALTVATPPMQNKNADDGPEDTVMQLTMRIEALEKENERLRREGRGNSLPDLPPAITGVLHTLPLNPAEQWTSQDLEDWAEMFKRVVSRAFRERITPAS